MKTLDEVIKALEICDETVTANCPDCPYDIDCENVPGEDLRADALYYLKAYKENGDKMIAEEKRMESLALAYIQALANMKDNPPLTFDELKQMEGKPVWVELLDGVGNNKDWNGWYVVSQFYPVSEIDEHVQFCSYHNLHRAKSAIGKTWNAYRKENK